MAKKKKKSSINKITLMLGFVILMTLFLGIGYARISDVNLELTGTAKANRQTGVVISNISYYADNNANLNASNINTYYKTMMDSKVVLANDANSSLTYQVTIKNMTDVTKHFQGVVYDDLFYSNPDIDFELNGLNINDAINAGESITFTITFKYKEAQASYTNTVLESCLNFKFDAAIIDEYSFTGVCQFNGQGEDIVGDCAEGQHIDFINTGIAPFSSTNHDKDFELGFTISNIDSSRFRNGKHDTIFDCINDTTPYPGIVFRMEDKKWLLQVGTGVDNKKLRWQPNEIQSFVLKKVNNKVFYSINGGPDIYVEDLSSIPTLNTPLTLGVALSPQGEINEERYLMADISDFYFRITEPGDVEEPVIRTYEVVDQEIADLLGKEMTVAFEDAGPHVFDGTDDMIINTGVELFNSDTYDDDFVITFMIDEFTKTGQVYQATLFNAKDESNSTYPGLMMRLNGDKFELGMKDGTGTAATVFIPLTAKRINVIKKDMKMYYQYDLSEILPLGNTNDFSGYPVSNTFTIPLTFGSNIDDTGAYGRKMKGTLSEMKVQVPSNP